jgi:hypothetical protein
VEALEEEGVGEVEEVLEAEVGLGVAPEAVVGAAAVVGLARPRLAVEPRLLDAPVAPGSRPGRGSLGWLERLGRRYRCTPSVCSGTSCMASSRCTCCGASLLDICRIVARSGRVGVASLDDCTQLGENVGQE